MVFPFCFRKRETKLLTGEIADANIDRQQNNENVHHITRYHHILRKAQPTDIAWLLVFNNKEAWFVSNIYLFFGFQILFIAQKLHKFVLICLRNWSMQSNCTINTPAWTIHNHVFKNDWELKTKSILCNILNSCSIIHIRFTPNQVYYLGLRDSLSYWLDIRQTCIPVARFACLQFAAGKISSMINLEIRFHSRNYWSRKSLRRFLSFFENFITFFGNWPNETGLIFGIDIFQNESERNICVLLILIQQLHHKHQNEIHKPTMRCRLCRSDIVRYSEFSLYSGQFLNLNNFW